MGVDAACAKLMGLDWRLIPSIKNAFSIAELPICDFAYEDIEMTSSVAAFNGPL